MKIDVKNKALKKKTLDTQYDHSNVQKLSELLFLALILVKFNILCTLTV